MDEKEKKHYLDDFFGARLPMKLAYLAKFVKDNGSNGFMVGNQMTLADFAMLELGVKLFFNPHYGPRCKDAIEKHPELVEYFKKRHEDPGWKEYLKRRKVPPTEA